MKREWTDLFPLIVEDRKAVILQQIFIRTTTVGVEYFLVFRVVILPAWKQSEIEGGIRLVEQDEEEDREGERNRKRGNEEQGIIRERRT
jgi:hypothetical protein